MTGISTGALTAPFAFIGPEFDTPKEYEFDRAYMNALFDYGFKLGAAGYPWRKTPPGLATQSAR